jgi:hypothetical protein
LAAPPPPTPAEAPPRRMPLPRAAGIAFIATIPLSLWFALRTGVVIFPVLTFILWRGVGPRALIGAAAALLAALPIVYAITSPRDRGGYNFNYSVDLIWAHWTGVAAIVLLGAAAWRILSPARRQRKTGPPPAVVEPDSRDERDGREPSPTVTGRSRTLD